MLKRLVVGLAEGAFSGALVAIVVERLGLGWDGPPVVYCATALLGVVTALVAGKPFWASGAKTEAAIKAAAGAFIAVVSMYGIRKWLADVTLGGGLLGKGPAALGDLPRAALPLVGMALALVFEIDDAFGPGEEGVRRRLTTTAPDEGDRAHDPGETSDAEPPHRAGRRG
jgi:hypothetical protein